MAQPAPKQVVRPQCHDLPPGRLASALAQGRSLEGTGAQQTFPKKSRHGGPSGGLLQPNKEQALLITRLEL